MGIKRLIAIALFIYLFVVVFGIKFYSGRVWRWTRSLCYCPLAGIKFYSRRVWRWTRSLCCYCSLAGTGRNSPCLMHVLCGRLQDFGSSLLISIVIGDVWQCPSDSSVSCGPSDGQYLWLQLTAVSPRRFLWINSAWSVTALISCHAFTGDIAVTAYFLC